MKKKNFITEMWLGHNPSWNPKYPFTVRIERRYIIKFYNTVTPSSLARLMRVIASKPMIETCRWKKGLLGGFWTNCSFAPYKGYQINASHMIYCPYCGKRIEVVE